MKLENILKTFVRYIIGDRSFFSAKRLKKKQGHFLGHFQCRKIEKKVESLFSLKRLKKKIGSLFKSFLVQKD